MTEIDMSKIKPCPFCGYVFTDMDEPEFCYPDGRPLGGAQLWKAGCIELAGGCTATVYGYSEQNAIEIWNRRPK
jgi:hypothetical protein